MFSYFSFTTGRRSLASHVDPYGFMLVLWGKARSSIKSFFGYFFLEKSILPYNYLLTDKSQFITRCAPTEFEVSNFDLSLTFLKKVIKKLLISFALFPIKQAQTVGVDVTRKRATTRCKKSN